MRLEQVGQFGGAANMLALNGDMVYLQVGPRLVTVGVSNPTDPTIIGRSNVLPGRIKAIAAQDEYALVEDDQGTVWQFETPASGDPQLIRSFGGDDPARPLLPRQARDFVQVGDYRVELAEEWWQGNELFLYVYKDNALVMTPIPPLPAGEAADTPYLVVRGQYAYAAIRDGLRIYDLSLPPERIVIFEDVPDDQGGSIFKWQEAGLLITDVGTLGHGCCQGYYIPDLCVIDNNLHLGTTWSLADPENPTQEEWQPDRPDCGSFRVSGGWILTNSVRNGTYLFLDMLDAAHPASRVVSADVPDGEIKAVSSDLLFFYTSRISGGPDTSDLLIFDIADPGQPKLVGSYPSIPDLNPHYTPIYVLGEYVYIRTSGGANPAKIVLDISDPSNLREVEAPNPSFFDPIELLVQGNTAYLLTENQLDIYSTDDLRTPLVTFDIPAAHDMWYSDGRLIVFAGSVLSIFNVSDPAHPELLAPAEYGTYQGVIYQAAIYGDYLYLHQLEDGLAIFKLAPN